MFKKRTFLSFRRPKSISGPPSHHQSRTLILTPPLSSGFVTPNEHPLETHDNRVATEPLFHENYITPTEEKQSSDDLFMEALSARNPEVDQFISDTQPDSVSSPVEEHDVEVEEFDDFGSDELVMECMTIDEVGVSYPSGSAKLIDHDPWRYSGVSRSSGSEVELSPSESYPLKIPPRSPYRSHFDPSSSSSSARSDSLSSSESVSSSPSLSMPSTPESSGWGLSSPNPSGEKISQLTQTQVVQA